jgi:pimeloyl-ACP methyl ester carboxylesterase
MIPFLPTNRGFATFFSFAMVAYAMCGSAFAEEGKNCALVLMHGKWGDTRSLSQYAGRIDPVCKVKLLEMPWSGRRLYDAAYPAALLEIDAQVKDFRSNGYKRVLVGGQSFGGNAALAYMASIGDADGVIVLSPGHSPQIMYERGVGTTAVDRARELLATGKGDERLEMVDLNQGKRRELPMTASILLSYFDPTGLGHIPASTARFKKAVPVLWVIGTADPLFPLGEGYAYANLPTHPRSKYWAIDSGHFNTPDAAMNGTLEWLKSLE